MNTFLRAAVSGARHAATSARHTASKPAALQTAHQAACQAGVRALAGAVVGAAAYTYAAESDPNVQRFKTDRHVGPAPFKKTGVYDLDLGESFPEVLPCFIEVSRGSRNKYEWDDKIGFLRLDRVLHSAVFYPHNYGFFPQTLCGDGDPLDVLVLGEPLVPGSIVDVRPLGFMIMEDEKGLDEKVLAVPTHDPRYAEYKTLRDVPDHLLREIAHFFGTYKALEKKKWAKVGGWKGTADTVSLIEDTHSAYKAEKKSVVSTPSK
eukprot:g6747.t1